MITESTCQRIAAARVGCIRDLINPVEPAGQQTREKIFRPPADTRRDPSVFTGRPTTHVVQLRENLYRIGLKYGLSAGEMQAANPGVNASTMQAGTILQIPPKR